MRTDPGHPLLYQVNSRAWLDAVGRRLGRPATLDDLGDEDLGRIADDGFDWVWMLGVWTTGEAGRRVSRTHEAWLAEFRRVLPDLELDDIQGSSFAIEAYEVHPALGGDAALQRLRCRLADRGLRLMVDFVPNHVAPDHPWTTLHPEYLVAGSEADLAAEPAAWCRVIGPRGASVFAHGRDPYFPPWPDTLQLDYGRPELRRAMRAELMRIAERCDGVRCDMAMLILPDVFRRTWNREAAEFWPEAIAAVRSIRPDFLFLAEVYWGLEAELQQRGFDYTYDKRLYDCLRAGEPRAVREHLAGDPVFQSKLARFIENHDEPRAAAVFPQERHQAAAVVALFAPGLRLIHQGQMQGCRVHLPTHLRRWPDEPVDEALVEFYVRLLAALRVPPVRDGRWMPIEPFAAWDGNGSWNGFVAFAWADDAGRIVLIAINYAPNEGQCRLRLPFPELMGRPVRLRDLLGPADWERDGGDLTVTGLYLELPAWGHHALAVEACIADGA